MLKHQIKQQLNCIAQSICFPFSMYTSNLYRHHIGIFGKQDCEYFPPEKVKTQILASDITQRKRILNHNKVYLDIKILALTRISIRARYSICFPEQL